MTSAEIAEPAPNAALYIDASSLLVLILGQTGHADVQARVVSWEKAGGNVVSSRLLWLEVRRVVIRERLAGNDFSPVAEDSLSRIEQVPVTDEVWERAARIPHHVRALDAIHLTTCDLVGATFLTAGLDGTICTVAASLGIPLI
jgi:predicted nucleic acid-binding protein